MDTSRWSNFFGTGALVLPAVMGLGTASLDAFALTEMVTLLLLLLAVAWDRIAAEAAGLDEDE